MKVIIEGRAFFPEGFVTEDDATEVPVEVRGPPDDDLEEWAVLLVHPKVSLEVSRDELERALRVFARGDGR